METVDRRVLAAVRFRDAITGEALAAGLRVEAEGVRWIRNRRGWWVAATAPGLEAHTTAFLAPPESPAPGSVRIPLSVRDDAGRYVARAAVLALPRSADPAAADAADSLFRPLEVDLYPAPAGRVSPGWAVIRASVTEEGRPLGGALLRVHRRGGDGELLGGGMTDLRGEALVAVAGIPVTTWREDAGEVLSTEVDASVRVLWQEGAGLPDPDRLIEGGHVVRTAEVTLASGREVALEL